LNCQYTESLMPGAGVIAFGNDSWVKVEDEVITWSKGLPKELWNLLNGRYCNDKQKNSPLKSLSFDNDKFFAFFEDGAWRTWGYYHEGLCEELNESEGDMEFFSFGENTSHIFRRSEITYWCGVPSRMDQLLKTRHQHTVTWAQLGCNGAYFLKYSDGQYYWGGLHESLDELLTNNQAEITRVYLSPSDNDVYYVEYTSQSAEWKAATSFHNEVDSQMHLDPYIILYTNNSIADRFSCGRSIYEVADDLRNGNVDVEDIPAIRVVKFEEGWYALDNRRLWTFANAEVSSIPVIVCEAFDNLIKKIMSMDCTRIYIRTNSDQETSDVMSTNSDSESFYMSEGQSSSDFYY